TSHAIMAGHPAEHARQTATLRWVALGILIPNTFFVEAALGRFARCRYSAIQNNVQTNTYDPRRHAATLPLLSCRLNRSIVSVRILHDFLRVRSRSISGSLLHWRISGGSKTFPEQSQTRVVVDSHRGLAAQRRFACRVLPSASIGRGDVRALAQRAHWR